MKPYGSAFLCLLSHLVTKQREGRSRDRAFGMFRLDPSRTAPIHEAINAFLPIVSTLLSLSALGIFYPLCSLAESSTKSSAEGPRSATGEENREKEAEEAKRLTELFLRSQNVFLRKGEAMVEFGTTYSRNDRTEFANVIGGVAQANTTRRFVDTTLIARYGILTDGLELDVIAPLYVHGEIQSDFGIAKSRQTDDGFGDLAAALRYQVWYERGNRPSLIVDVIGKSRTGGSGLTGTGVWNTGGGVTLMKSIDPVILFGRFGYLSTFAAS